LSIVNNIYSDPDNKVYSETKLLDGELNAKEVLENKYERASYNPTQEEKDARSLVLRDFVKGMTNMWTPRVELNDLSVIQRMNYDQAMWNTYQANNGQPSAFDDINGWRSNAMRPIIRNKCISIAAHATARLIFPKVFAYDQTSDDDKDTAQVMEDLMEWAADKSNYAWNALRRVISALVDPVSIGYTEYAETYRKVKRIKEDGSWVWDTMLDEDLSGFQDQSVSVDELYIENFYEPDVQKQGFLILRRVISYSLAQAKYSALYENFNKYVKPGVQTVYSDANQSFYWVYDPNMRAYDVEEVIYWNKSSDLKLILVNGVLLNKHDNPNPRIDKLYPFDVFGYELINNRCFYYKSLAFKMMQDANIINTLYPMVIDGTYLNLMPPVVHRGSEVIGSSVIVPGAVTNLTDPNAKIEPVKMPTDINSGLVTLGKVEESINQSSADNIQQGQQTPKGNMTAYEVSKLEANAATVLGLFVQMIAKHVKEYGRLRLGDILQYLTIADIDKLEADGDMVYKSFILHDKDSWGSTKTRKIRFDPNLPDELTPKEMDDMSLAILAEEGGLDSKDEIYKVNPWLFRNRKYELGISPDVMNPKSEDLERMYDLDTYDKMVVAPQMFDPEETARFLLGTNPKTRRDPDKYLPKQNPLAPMMNPLQNPQNPQNSQNPQSPAQGLSTGQVPSIPLA
jgi:hypothetical protein